MKLNKMFGLAIIAALAAMALIGSGSASADTLCKENVEECPEASRYPIGTEIVGKTPAGEPAAFLTSNFEIKCDLEIKGKTTENEGAHTGVRGVIEAVNVSNCTGACEVVKPVNLPWEGLIKAEGEHATVTSSGAGKPGVLAEGCTVFKVSCQFTAEKFLFTYKEGQPAHITANKLPIKREGHSALCPAEGAWDALYVAVSPEGPLFGSALP